ncbi:multidrug effflux MFS transporter [Streptomyces sp. CdTB01]|uniref:multidrug effflux MFS transporter n=1 Tax=Streptomyces sp. CdTB01 TaxID=1725411 RepID=UPI00099E38DD|nr:multidrug effflux MFS transporter [Streptomyces sp. CdTB01]
MSITNDDGARVTIAAAEGSGVVEPAADPPRRARLALILGALSAFGALTIDMYLPAMPRMADQLHTSAPLVQMTLTAFVVGLALFQVVVGPLSDAWGRRRPLLAGMALYLAGSLWCALAPSVGWLIAGRILQSLGAAAGTVLARAIVRDLFSGASMTRFFSTLMVVNGVAPVVAPVIGGRLLTLATWRAVFLVLAAAGAVLLLAVVVALPESLPDAHRAPAHLRATLRTFRTLATDLQYMRYVLAAALMFAAVFAYISGSSFVLQDAYGLTAQQFGLVFGLNGLGIVLLGQVGGLLVGRVADEHTLLRVSLTVATLGSAGVLACAVFRLPLPLLLACLFLVVSVLGIVLANATSLALGGHGSAAGAASSLQGLLQFLVGGLAASVMSLPGQVTAVSMGATMLVCATAALAVLSARRT